MLYDDRLGTVLRHRPGGPTAAKTQFRQLLDLLGTLPSEARGSSVDAAYLRVAELGKTIGADEKRLMLADSSLRLRSPRLLALLAHDAPAVAADAIGRARLSDQEWLDLIPALPVPARGFLRRRNDLGTDVRALLDALGVHDRGLPPLPGAKVEATVEPAAEPVASPAVAPAPPVVGPTLEEESAAYGISALVKRIEAFRKARQPTEPANDRSHAPRLPLGEEAFVRVPRELRAFDFACDAEGRITWADPGVAPMTVGMSLPAAENRGTGEVARALRQLQPLRAIRLTLSGAPAVAGDWQVDAAPWFEAAGGRLAGWRGRFRRPPASAADARGAEATAAESGEADRIRQLLHELRTPINAIQGYAEAMQQGLFGPIGHEYRAMSASIAADAARILGGFEELERLARLDSRAMELESGVCDLAEVIAATVTRLQPHTAARQSSFDLELGDEPATVPLARIEAERMVWRLLATLASAAAPGERLRLRLRARGGEVRFRVQLPVALAGLRDEDLFRAAAMTGRNALSAGNFGGGFALRLAAAEARAAGGNLERRGDRLRLVLAGLTGVAAAHSDGAGLAGSQLAGSN
ncbi:MAG: histidine kinase related protein [Novosphingobium sp.]|nr:histidine kinase related protein [Novosphingobium sp.]